MAPGSRSEEPGAALSPALFIERPPGLSTEDPRAQAIDRFNQAALLFATRIGTDDEKARNRRWTAVLVLASVLVVGTFVTIWLIVTQDDLGTAIAAAVAVVAVLAVAGFVNPLQTIERDIVYRRWSDLLTASFFLQAGDYHATLKDLRSATRQTAADFAVLAASYGKLSTRTLQSIEDVASSADETEADDEITDDDTKGDLTEDAAGGTQESAAISVTSPGKQESTVGSAVEGLKLVASGPGDLVFGAAGLPRGIVIDPGTGEFSGTPVEATAKAAVEVTVTATAQDAGKATVAFTWVVTDPAGEATTGEAPLPPPTERPDQPPLKKPIARVRPPRIPRPPTA